MTFPDLIDQTTLKRFTPRVEGDDTDLLISFPGLGTVGLKAGPVVAISVEDGWPVVRVYSDIESEDATHVISLEHAQEGERPDNYVRSSTETIDPGPCVTCGWPCIADGSLAVICPKCTALEKAATLQQEYWDALSDLETELDITLDDASSIELHTCTVTSLIEDYGGHGEEEEDLEDVPSPLDDNEPDEDEPL